jgi:hypothetical protein
MKISREFQYRELNKKNSAPAEDNPVAQVRGWGKGQTGVAPVRS